jgi:hypothetical protein
MRTVTVVAVFVLLMAAVSSIRFASAQPHKPPDAPTLQLELERQSLENVDDKAGRWQFLGGRVTENAKHVADYAAVARVVKQGTEAQNTAAVTTTIFFMGEKPPQNITLQGAHDFHSGGQVGSVSAASGKYAAYVGKPFSISVPPAAPAKPKLTIN